MTTTERCGASSRKVRLALGSPGASGSSATRCAAWRDGVIPDLAEAVASPQLLTDDPDHVQRLLDLVPHVPTPVWGRDELGAGRDVELELADLLAACRRRPGCRVDPASRRWACPRLGRGRRCRTSPSGSNQNEVSTGSGRRRVARVARISVRSRSLRRSLTGQLRLNHASGSEDLAFVDRFWKPACPDSPARAIFRLLRMASALADQ